MVDPVIRAAAKTALDATLEMLKKGNQSEQYIAGIISDYVGKDPDANDEQLRIEYRDRQFQNLAGKDELYSSILAGSLRLLKTIANADTVTVVKEAGGGYYLYASTIDNLAQLRAELESKNGLAYNPVKKFLDKYGDALRAAAERARAFEAGLDANGLSGGRGRG